MKTSLTKLLILLLLVIGCKSQFQVKENRSSEEYKIKTIENHNKFFVVYASRNDSVFKIISDKVDSVSYGDYKKIRRGGWYRLSLRNINEKAYKAGYVGLNISTRLMYFGEYVPVEKKSHYELYVADNLQGLYFLQDTSSANP